MLEDAGHVNLAELLTDHQLCSEHDNGLSIEGSEKEFDGCGKDDFSVDSAVAEIWSHY